MIHKDLFEMMDKLESSVKDLQNTFINLKISFGHYGMDGESAEETERMVRGVTEEEFRDHMLSIIDGSAVIVYLLKELRIAACEAFYEVYL